MSVTDTPIALLSLADVAKIVGFSDRWLRELRAAGRMPPPAPVSLGKKHGRLRWHPAVIDAWLRGEWHPANIPAAPETPQAIRLFTAGPAAPGKRPGPRRKPA